MTPSPETSEFLSRLAELPPFPSTALRLLSLSAESATAIQDFENAFKSDPALAADLLQTANSPEFGLRARVDSIKHAVTLLGLDRVSSLAATIAMRSYIRDSPRIRIMQPMWLHGIAAAVVAETLGGLTGLPPAGLYTAGLVHDIGRLGFLIGAGEQYTKLLGPPTVRLDESNAREQEAFGVDHAAAGALVAEAWGFPETLRNAIRLHHQDREHSEEKVRQVRAACRLAGALGYPEHPALFKETVVDAMAELPRNLRSAPALRPERLQPKIASLLNGLSGLK